MIKSCKEIAKDIDELKRKIQQDRLTEMALADFSDKKKCNTPDVLIICNNCNCWKIYHDKISVES